MYCYTCVRFAKMRKQPLGPMKDGVIVQPVNWATIAQRAEENCIHALEQVPPLPPDISLEAFIRAATDVGPLDHYKYFSDAARGMLEHIKASCGVPAARAFLRAALGRTISTRASAGQYEQLPPLCAYFHARQLDRIAHDFDTAPNWLDLHHDLFQKEFGIASLRLYAAGAELVNYRCGIPRSIVLRGGGLGKIAANITLMLRLGGFKPYFQSHIHTFNLDSFNEEGRNDLYRCCAELYALHPECLGMFGSSWFYDPVLDRISPRLSYLRTIPLAGGAHLLEVQDGGEATSSAIAKSATRRKLYEEDKYLPKTYTLVWGRKKQIKWARAHARLDA